MRELNKTVAKKRNKTNVTGQKCHCTQQAAKRSNKASTTNLVLLLAASIDAPPSSCEDKGFSELHYNMPMRRQSGMIGTIE
jgi:hypothetical protein